MFCANSRAPCTSTTPRFTITSISVPTASSGALPTWSRPGSNERCPSTPPSARPSSRPLNSGRSRSSGTRSWSSRNAPPTITSRSIETPSPRRPEPPPSFGMSSPPGPSGGEGKAWIRSVRPSSRTREKAMWSPRHGATLGRTRTEAISRKGGASGAIPPTRSPRSSSSAVASRTPTPCTVTGRLKARVSAASIMCALHSGARQSA